MDSPALHLRRRSLDDIAGEDRASPEARVHHASSLAPARIGLPALPIGAHFLERWPIRQEPLGVDWRAAHYDSLAPAVFTLRDALVHSSAGIVGVGGDAVEETLAHTLPERQGFRWSPAGVALDDLATDTLDGGYITVLAGAPRNYFHAVVEGVLRLSAVPPHVLQGARGVLYPADGICQEAMLRLMGLRDTLALVPVAPRQRMAVETLIFPVSVGGGAAYHPCVVPLLDRMSSHVRGQGAGLPRRVFLARGHLAFRPLLEEEAVAEALRPFGFVAVRAETMAVDDQIRLFRDAEAVVAPHGAGLTNLGFCHPGCVVLELQMDAYVNWCFRHFAALRGLRYDCVLGRAVGAWGGPHGLAWRISPQHVAAAVAQMLG